LWSRGKEEYYENADYDVDSFDNHEHHFQRLSCKKLSEDLNCDFLSCPRRYFWRGFCHLEENIVPRQSTLISKANRGIVSIKYTPILSQAALTYRRNSDSKIPFSLSSKPAGGKTKQTSPLNCMTSHELLHSIPVA
jgi:hypothetical protein